VTYSRTLRFAACGERLSLESRVRMYIYIFIRISTTFLRKILDGFSQHANLYLHYEISLRYEYTCTFESKCFQMAELDVWMRLGMKDDGFY